MAFRTKTVNPETMNGAAEVEETALAVVGPNAVTVQMADLVGSVDVYRDLGITPELVSRSNEHVFDDAPVCALFAAGMTLREHTGDSGEVNTYAVLQGFSPEGEDLELACSTYLTMDLLRLIGIPQSDERAWDSVVSGKTPLADVPAEVMDAIARGCAETFTPPLPMLITFRGLGKSPGGNKNRPRLFRLETFRALRDREDARAVLATLRERMTPIAAEFVANNLQRIQEMEAAAQAATRGRYRRG